MLDQRPNPASALSLCDWVKRASRLLREEEASVASTPLIEFQLGQGVSAQITLKDESLHPTGSLKHRVARALFQYGLSNGDIGPHVHIVEASSGCAAISEACFAKLLGLQFTAVVPASTAQPKIDAIRAYGGNVEFARPGQDLWSTAASFADRPGYLFLDQFEKAEKASCWRGNSSIAYELIDQLDSAGTALPNWIVVGAGTGGTSSAIGRHLRHQGHWGEVKLCVVDPEGSIFFRQFSDPQCEPGGTNKDYIEGIGRKRPSPSFIPGLIDRMIEVPDAASIAAVHWLRGSQGVDFGPSTGTNVIGAMILASEIQEHEERPRIVTLGCDPGARYEATIFNSHWLEAQQLDLSPWLDRIDKFIETGTFDIGPIRQIFGFKQPPRTAENQDAGR